MECEVGRAGSAGKRGDSRVLVLADQSPLLRVIALALSQGRLMSRSARNVAEATDMLRAWPPHLVLVDMDVEGAESLEWLFNMQRRLPVIALTRRDDLQARLVAFEHGFDDILIMPFPPEELLARSLAVLRRAYCAVLPLMASIRIGELEVSLLHRRARIGTRELRLTPVEQSLLYLLAANAGRLLTRTEILDSLWGADYMPESNVVDRHVTKLRAKLQDHPRRPRFIVTVPGRGYRFIPNPPPAGGGFA